MEGNNWKLRSVNDSHSFIYPSFNDKISLMKHNHKNLNHINQNNLALTAQVADALKSIHKKNTWKNNSLKITSTLPPKTLQRHPNPWPSKTLISSSKITRNKKPVVLSRRKCQQKWCSPWPTKNIGILSIPLSFLKWMTHGIASWPESPTMRWTNSRSTTCSTKKRKQI